MGDLDREAVSFRPQHRLQTSGSKHTTSIFSIGNNALKFELIYNKTNDLHAKQICKAKTVWRTKFK